MGIIFAYSFININLEFYFYTRGVNKAMWNIKMALAVWSVCTNLLPSSSFVDNMAAELKLPDTGDYTMYSICEDVSIRASEYGKTVKEYVLDGGNVPIFHHKNSQDYLGRFYITNVGVNVAIYDSWKQSVCDKKDSACFFKYGTQRVVADHWNQGFDKIKKCKIGDEAYITDGVKTERFICTDIIDGHNIDGKLTDWDGNDIRYWNEDGITCYTCNGNSKNIKIVFFKKA